MFTLISQRDGDICGGDEGIIRFVQFIISREHSPELLDIAEVTFYNITLLIQLLTVTSPTASFFLDFFIFFPNISSFESY